MVGDSAPRESLAQDPLAQDSASRDSFPRDLTGYLAASTGLPQPTTIRVLADINAYYNETVDQYVRRRHAELRRRNRKNDEIWPEIAAEITHRRFTAPDLTERQLRRMVYG
jgi:hypothetical protein